MDSRISGKRSDLREFETEFPDRCFRLILFIKLTKLRSIFLVKLT